MQCVKMEVADGRRLRLIHLDEAHHGPILAWSAAIASHIGQRCIRAAARERWIAHLPVQRRQETAGRHSMARRVTSDAAKIAAWWRRWPDALVGIDAGKSGLVVIDADRHAWAADGVAALQKVVGAPLQSLGCPVVETAGNGVHLYFRAPEGETFGNSAGSLPAGVNVRGMGGYVIGPGSTRADGSSSATWHG